MGSDRMDAATFVASVIGRAYEPAGLHCWELVRRCRFVVFGDELPAALTAPSDKLALAREMAKRDRHAGWEAVTEPSHGAVVFMARRGHGPSRAAIHAGIWLDLDGGGVLHTDNPHGVVFETLPELNARNWAEPSFYAPIP